MSAPQTHSDNPFHAHHFATYEDQFQAAKLGMWVFLVTEILMFGGLFVGYGIYKALYPAAFHTAHQFLDVKLGALNTVVLLLSSMTMAMSVTATALGQKSRALGLLLATFVCAGIFMVVKYFEYTHKFHLGLFPAGLMQREIWSAPAFLANVAPLAPELAEKLTDPHTKTFFSFYFAMTGLHGIHVLIGMGLIAWMMLKVQKGTANHQHYVPVELVGYYWHIVDLIWIFLFPLVYLVS